MSKKENIDFNYGGDGVGLNSPVSNVKGIRPTNWIMNVTTKHGETRITTNAHERLNIVIPCRCVTCIQKQYSDLVVGEPVATNSRSKKKMKEDGYVGLYRVEKINKGDGRCRS